MRKHVKRLGKMETSPQFLGNFRVKRWMKSPSFKAVRVVYFIIFFEISKEGYGQFFIKD